jgi:hypothetical protein
VFYPSYGTYTKTFIIFGLAPDLLHNFKHQAILIKKEKEKQHCAVGCLGTGPQAGPHALGPHPRCARRPFSLSGH